MAGVRSRVGVMLKLAEQLEDECGSFIRAHVMWFSSLAVISSIEGCLKYPEDQGTRAEYLPRTNLMAGVRLLFALPFAFSWVLLVMTFARRPVSRWWALGGAVGVLLGLVGLGAGASLLAHTSVDLLSDGGYMLAHFGLWAGHKLSSTSFARWVFPQHSLDRSALPRPRVEEKSKPDDEERSLPDLKSPAQDEQTKKTATLDDGARTISMVWLASFTAEIVISSCVPSFSKLRLERTTADTIKLVIFPITFLAISKLYVAIAYAYFRSTTHIAWECTCGGLTGAASLLLLHSTTPFSTWQTWTIDGMLAFLCLNIGILGGFSSRDGRMARMFSTNNSL